MSDKKVTRRLSIFINDKEVINSLSGIGREIGATKREMNNLNKSSETYNEDLARLQKRLEGLNKAYAEQKEEIHGNAQAYDSASDSLKNFFGAIMSGDIKGATAELGNLKGGIQGVTKSAMAFIATPIGVAILALSGIALATKHWLDYNNAANETNKTIREMTGLAGEALDDARVRATAIQETFGKPFEETMEAAKVLVNEFGISYSEALDKISSGLVKGHGANKEYFESLREYATFFSQAGYSVEEFQNIIDAGFDLGIYTDKLPDAIKEFYISITEQTTSSRDALINAFGVEFTDKLLEGVTKGSISVKESLEQISAEAERLGLNSQQAQQLTADLFRGAGEDAGGSLKVFEAVNVALKEENRILTEAEQRINDLADANLELKQAKDRAMRSDSLLTFQQDLELFWVKFKTWFYDAFAQWKQHLELQWIFTKAVFKSIKETVKEVVDIFKDFDITKPMESFRKLMDVRAGFTDKVKENTAAMLEERAETIRLAKEEEKRAKQAEINNQNSLKAEEVKKKAQAEAEKERKRLAKEREKAEKDAAKLAEDTAKQLAEAKLRLAKAELAYFLQNERSKLEGVKRLNQELVDEEISRLEKIKKVKLDDAEAERQRQIELAKQKVLSEDEMTDQLKAIDLEYQISKQQLELEFQQSTHKLKDDFEAQKKLEAAERLKIENELQVVEAENTWEEQKIKEEQLLQGELDRYKQLLEDKKISKAEYDRFVESTTKKSAETQAQIELQKTSTILGAFGQLTAALGEMFGQTKELAKAQALINGAQAITQIWASQATGVLWVDVALKAAQSIAVAATTAQQIKEINKQKAPKKAKFFYGGNTGTTPWLGYDEYGPVTGVVHKNEYVIPESMTQDPRYANTITWLEAERQGKIKRFNQGGFTSTSPVDFSPNPSDTNPDSMAIYNVLDRLTSVLEGGIQAKTYIGYEEQIKLNDLQTDIKNSSTNGIL